MQSAHCVVSPRHCLPAFCILASQIQSVCIFIHLILAAGFPGSIKLQRYSIAKIQYSGTISYLGSMGFIYLFASDIYLLEIFRNSIYMKKIFLQFLNVKCFFPSLLSVLIFFFLFSPFHLCFLLLNQFYFEEQSKEDI